jgi:hypothetical protein
MKIIVNSDEAKFKLRLPLSLMKSRLLINFISKRDPSGEFKKLTSNKELLKKCYKELKKHKGLVLVDVESKDTKVKIII